MRQPLQFEHALPPMRLVLREEYIVQQCSGKKVLHLGFVDSGLTEERIASGDWLHGRITEVAERAVGVDVDAEGIEDLRRSGVTDIVQGDIEHLDQMGLPSDFDVVVAGEVLEHLLCPGAFLSSCRRFLESSARLVVTVPNAFHYPNFENTVRGVEVVHPDHKYWFSYNTLLGLTKACGLDVIEVLGYVASQQEAARLASTPHLCNGLILVAAST